MKKLFFAAVAALSVLFTSCSNELDETPNAPAGNEEGSFVKISLSGGQAPGLRSFYDNTAQAEPWEKTLHSLTVYVYNATNGIFSRRAFTAEELSSLSVSFCLPASQPGDNCEFTAIANLQTPVNNRAALLALLENSNLYNGKFSTATTGAIRPDGFVMTGKTAKTLSSDGSITPVSITIRRTVAKVAVETVVAPEFYSKYPGSDIQVSSASVVRGASTSHVVEQTTPSTGTMNYSFTQLSDYNPVTAGYGNLFYLFENGETAASNRVTLEINATFDLDGAWSTPDQYPMTYRVELGDEEGRIVRNSYYRIQARIVGLSDNEVKVEIQVADWEGPCNQTVSVGI